MLDDLGRDDFVNDLHAMICTFAREQQITQEQMRQVNVEVNNALELRREIEVREAKLKAREADVNARVARVNA